MTSTNRNASTLLVSLGLLLVAACNSNTPAPKPNESVPISSQVPTRHVY